MVNRVSIGQDFLVAARRMVLEVFRIEAGIPKWGFELDGETLPPEAGLDCTAIDYRKGCYIGQEFRASKAWDTSTRACAVS
jgi:folate-binding protein YgfZ